MGRSAAGRRPSGVARGTAGRRGGGFAPKQAAGAGAGARRVWYPVPAARRVLAARTAERALGPCVVARRNAACRRPLGLRARVATTVRGDELSRGARFAGGGRWCQPPPASCSVCSLVGTASPLRAALLGALLLGRISSDRKADRCEFMTKLLWVGTTNARFIKPLSRSLFRPLLGLRPPAFNPLMGLL